MIRGIYVRPRSVPAVELHSRAESSVGIMYRSRGPNTGSNPGERQIQKKLQFDFTGEHLWSSEQWLGTTGLLIRRLNKWDSRKTLFSAEKSLSKTVPVNKQYFFLSLNSLL